MLTQGTWRLRRTVGPPSSGALSVGTVLRYSSAGRNARASTGTFSFKDMEGSSALSMSSSEDSLGPHCAGEETLAATRREPRSAYAQARNAPLAPLSSYSAYTRSPRSPSKTQLLREDNKDVHLDKATWYFNDDTLPLFQRDKHGVKVSAWIESVSME